MFAYHYNSQYLLRNDKKPEKKVTKIATSSFYFYFLCCLFQVNGRNKSYNNKKSTLANPKNEKQKSVRKNIKEQTRFQKKNGYCKYWNNN